MPKYSSFIVVLDEDLSQEEAQHTIIALGQIKGVIGVEPQAAVPSDYLALIRAKHHLFGVIKRSIEEVK